MELVGRAWGRALTLGVGAALVAGAASSAPIVVDGTIDGFAVQATVEFAFNDQCSVDCALHISLTNSTPGQLSSIARTLAGITFEPDSAITIDRTQSTVLVDTDMGDILVGSASAAATADLMSGTHLDVTRHWGFDQLLVPVPEAGGSGMLGSYVVSAVGDVANESPILGNVGLIGSDDLFTGSGTISGVEPNPPNGTHFTIVNDATCSPDTCGGLRGGFQDPLGRVWIQDTVWISLHYDGLLESVSKVEPIYGTNGLPGFVIPEPGVGLLLLGLLPLLGRLRSR